LVCRWNYFHHQGCPHHRERIRGTDKLYSGWRIPEPLLPKDCKGTHGLYTEPNTGVYKQQNEAIADILKRLEALEALAFTQEPSEENTKSTSEKAAASGVQMHKLRRPKSRVL
jgi:hypothetical protein